MTTGLVRSSLRARGEPRYPNACLSGSDRRIRSSSTRIGRCQIRRKTRVLFAAVAAVLCAAMAVAGENASSSEHLGTVHFSISCNAAAQPQFDRAIALLHSFWYEEAVKAFTEV